MFKWAASHELIPASVHHGLATVEGLRKGRSPARETDPVKPVPEAHIDAVKPLVSRQVRALIDLQLLTDLGLVSIASYNRLEDPFSGFDRDTYTWTQRLDARPHRTWFFELGYDYTLTETPDMESLLERTNLFLRTRWAPGAYLSLNGAWRYYEDDFSDTLRQNYGIVYTPGPKLVLTASVEEFDSDIGRATSNNSLGFSYRMYPRVLLTGTLLRSKFDQNIGSGEKINSAQLGLTIGF